VLDRLSASDFARERRREIDVERALCEPFELTESELDMVAGGNPFSASSVFGNPTTNNSGNFAIGAVLGDFSTASGLFVGRLNALDIIYIEPTTSIVVNNNISLL
jgi:hypothetical protein